jgi:hypothetical protein
MIKKGTQHKFDGIQTLEDLKRVSLGQGRFWADTNVLALLSMVATWGIGSTGTSTAG